MDKNFFKKTFFLGLVVFVFSFAQHAIASSCPFTRELSSGVTHQEVAELQRFLSNDSTIYPEKLVTGYYGNLTVNAVKRFQGGAGLLQSGKVDMATMNALCMIFEQFVLQTGGYSEPAKVATTTAKAITQAPQDFSSSGSSCPFDRELSLGNKNNAVTELQKFLSNDESIYPEKMVTGYYGNLTVNAIKRFQAKAGLLQSGKVDMATSTVLCQMFLSYKLSEPVKIDVSFSSDGCVVKTVNLGPGYFEAANSEVASLQKYLNQNGFYPENIVSGFYGNLTAAAVKRLQSHYGIKATGVIDKDTMTVICGSASSAYSDSSGSIDLAISNIEADPAQIDVNVPVKISVSHKNIGNINSGNHRTSLLINEQEVAFMQSNGLKPNEEINSINHT